ncbi:zinc ribbon domain-containing protein [Idiomarina sp. HP20-50]|uniref:zinc ribbon domain-containing protein n=1 Tax=Idiomarina sp. HP20-50 TaxID=3070813 RepID=UPI00294B44CD|nr:zinc ribbon domain-containing protein [Idiomarina sp. HP20-50]MDV6316433.1 zinc ribbon domain-containing protein [Idiomarina sp. HP20-50]
MVFEKCPKCEDQVLDNKYSCPACGYVKPDKSDKSEDPDKQNQPGENNITTENTSKSLTIQGVLSLVILIVGVFWFFLTADEYRQSGEINIIALIMFVGGLAWYILTRFRIWREHR